MDIISNIIKELIQDHYTYISICERKVTEYERLIASIKIKTKELQSHTILAGEYYKFQLQEREKLFDSACSVLNKAIEVGDDDIALIAINTIEIIHKKNPFTF